MDDGKEIEKTNVAEKEFDKITHDNPDTEVSEGLDINNKLGCIDTNILRSKVVKK